MVNVKIYEHRNVKCENESGDLQIEFKAELKKESTCISLPQPILIRRNFVYVIQMGPFPQAHFYYSDDLRTHVQLAPDISVKFYDYHIDNDVILFDDEFLLVEQLEFNRI